MRCALRVEIRKTPNSKASFQGQSLALLNSTKSRVTSELAKRFCKWCKTAVVYMFISNIVLFISKMKCNIDHDRNENVLRRWT
jgi:hypothetical protein